ncbi:hypothetical protein E6C67_26695 [Azospirillum sp. TSA2s]|uniref:hypothetical protein n=1 Tax=Azospirillum sp. TSA2s TaxID=709810 RepID=UPI0010A9F885|nr:hypothetical protein [Azospirillum sp. TSA2s]QCG97364.1 hypothetical protein E6C67_26695 [Azospirillum sp. TSA2s]
MTDDDFEERAAILEFDGGLPRAWAESLARLATSPRPGAYLPERWETIVSDAHRLVDGHWRRLEAVGLGPADVRELIRLIDGRDIVAVGMGDVTVRMPAGNRVKIFMRPRIGQPPVWQEGRRAA